LQACARDLAVEGFEIVNFADTAKHIEVNRP
jgi:hypothetical protein